MKTIAYLQELPYLSRAVAYSSLAGETGLFLEPRQMKTMPMAHITTSTGISPFKRNLRCPEPKNFWEKRK